MSEPVHDGGDKDEAALDAELQASIDAVKAGKTLDGAQPVASVPTGPTGASVPTGAIGPTGATGGGDGNPQPTGATGPAEFRLPNKGKFESDEAYEKRVELFDLVKRRKAATTPEAKEALTADIKRAKGELKNLGSAERFIRPRNDAGPTGPTGPTGGADPELQADKERLKAIGGASKEDVAAIIAQTQHEAQVRSDLQNFVGKHAELKDEDVREVFFDFVQENYAWEGKSGKALAATLEMAFENMFRPAESVTDRVLKAAGVQEKVGAMGFPGGTGGKTTYSPEMQKSIDELKATGMSEEKAVELLSDN
jgi:hypothetical protein